MRCVRPVEGVCRFRQRSIIMENTLNLGVTREHLDVLPVRIVRYVVDYQDQVFTHLGVADDKREYVCRLECCQWPICLLWLAFSPVMSRVTGQTYPSSSNMSSPLLFEAKRGRFVDLLVQEL